MIDINCSSYSTLCISDENEIYMWGNNIFKSSEIEPIKEPQLIWKSEEGYGSLNIMQDDN
jgi:alpha-tubulin suppressor-like RCC1 family protein